MNDAHAPTVAKLLNKMPDWLRHDLASKDNAIRARAEEALTAMIMAALGDDAGDRKS
jgi:hypothetical protein